MSDTRALTRLLDEFVWVLRREGFAVAPSEAIDLLRIVRVLGWESRDAIREASAAIIVKRPVDRSKLDAAFAEFFTREASSSDLWERLRLEGFTSGEVQAVRELLQSLASSGDESPLSALLQGGMYLDGLLQLSGVNGVLAGATSALQWGFISHRVAELVGIPKAHSALAQLRLALRDMLGARGDILVSALEKELDCGIDVFRARVRASLARTDRARTQNAGLGLADTPFTSLTDLEVELVRRAVRTFAERLRGAARVRLRRAKRGRIDVARTMRGAAHTGSVPFQPLRRRRRRDKPRLLLLCDVSDSVRVASRFMLEFLYAAHDLFDRVRSFVFVGELGETTALFQSQSPESAFAAVYAGAVIPITSNSNYGRVLRQFEAEELRRVDRRTTVVILGDGRTNYLDPAEAVVRRVRARARAVYWMCPESRRGWTSGDSVMGRYAPLCSRVFEVTTARELETAARSLVASR